MHKSHKKSLGPPDRFLLSCVIALSLFGILMVYDSSVAIAIRDFSNQYHFVVEQARWLFIGFLAFAICYSIDYHRWYKLSVPILLGTLTLLLAVFVPGVGIGVLGAHRWIHIGSIVIQPAELAKFSLILYLSAWFSVPERGRLLAFLLLLGMIFGLIIIEPDFGTSVIIVMISFLMYFFSDAPLWQFAVLLPILVGFSGILAVLSPYRVKRIMTFLNPQSDPLGASYQIRQVLLGLGSGGFWGLGFGKSRQKYEYLPEANTDSIFAIIGEEIGFIGATIVILAFLFIVFRSFRIARSAPDRFGRLLASGIASWIGVQTAINLSAMVALIPLTGVPLPLISYGGSGLIVMLGAFGVLLNISRKR